MSLTRCCDVQPAKPQEATALACVECNVGRGIMNWGAFATYRQTGLLIASK